MKEGMDRKRGKDLLASYFEKQQYLSPFHRLCFVTTDIRIGKTIDRYLKIEFDRLNKE